MNVADLLAMLARCEERISGYAQALARGLAVEPEIDSLFEAPR